LKLSSTGNVGAKTSTLEVDLVANMLTAKQSFKYAGPELEVMLEISGASQSWNLKQFEAVIHKYPLNCSKIGQRPSLHFCCDSVLF
jgi:hypothetical protein